METRVTIFDRGGRKLTTLIDVSSTRGWLLNQIGSAYFKVARTDAAFNKEILKYRNLVTIEHDRAGTWGGFIWTEPQGFQFDNAGVLVTCASGETLLKLRYTMLNLPNATAGDTLAALVAEANGKEDLQLRIGDVWSGGKSSPRDFRMMRISQGIAGYQDAWVEPALNNGLLTFQVNFLKPRGVVQRGMILEEGVNTARDTSPMLTEQGVITNHMLVYSNAATIDQRVTAEASDATSLATYGLCEDAAATGGGDLATEAADRVALARNPRKIYQVSATDDNGTFDYLGMGDTIRLKLPSIGFEGTDTWVRIIGKEFSDDSGKMTLALREAT